MSCRHLYRAIGVGLLTSMLAGTALSATNSFEENFDAYTSEGDSVTGTNGWTANSSVIVTNSPSVSALRAAYIPDQESLTNSTAVGGGTNIWVDMQIQLATMQGEPGIKR